MISTLHSPEFRHAYHEALDHTAHTPEAQRESARKVLEKYFRLEEIGPDTPLAADSFYFIDQAVEIHGIYKFLVPGSVHRDLITGHIFLLKPKPTVIEHLVKAKEFDSAIAGVEAVRLTLIPERVNGIISFLSDGRRFFDHDDLVGAERSIGTALDHFNRAANDGLRKIQSEAERGKRSNELAGTRRMLMDMRRKLQDEIAGHE